MPDPNQPGVQAVESSDEPLNSWSKIECQLPGTPTGLAVELDVVDVKVVEVAGVGAGVVAAAGVGVLTGAEGAEELLVAGGFEATGAVDIWEPVESELASAAVAGLGVVIVIGAGVVFTVTQWTLRRPCSTFVVQWVRRPSRAGLAEPCETGC
ncbi:MAG: hypothetical protein JWM85_1721 [Acidimicrobiaceae bacterium]|nr:hypothetical protein [Acidimicrobiaceae bacterium]